MWASAHAQNVYIPVSMVTAVDTPENCQAGIMEVLLYKQLMFAKHIFIGHLGKHFVHYTVRTHLPSKVLAQQSGSHGDEYTIADTGQIQHSLSQHKANVE